MTVIEAGVAPSAPWQTAVTRLVPSAVNWIPEWCRRRSCGPTAAGMTVIGAGVAPSATWQTAASRLVPSAVEGASGGVPATLVRADHRRNDGDRSRGCAIRALANGSDSPRAKRGELDSGVVPATLVRADRRRNDGDRSRGCAIRDLANGSVSPRAKRGRRGVRRGAGDARAGRPPPE